MATDEYIQEPLFPPGPDEPTELVVGGYKMTYVQGYWRRSALPKTKKETEE